MIFLLAILLTSVVGICVRLAWGTPIAIAFVLLNIAVIKYAPAGTLASILVSGVVAYLVIRTFLNRIGPADESSESQ